MDAGRKVSIEREVFPDVVAAGRLYAMATDDYWIDAGSPTLYLQANLDLIDGKRHDHSCAGVQPGADVDATATVSGSLVDDGATVAAHARVTGSVVLAGAVVGRRAVVANSVVMGRIGQGASVTDVVLGHGAGGNHGIWFQQVHRCRARPRWPSRRRRGRVG